MIHMIKDWYPKCKKNSWNSMKREQTTWLKNGHLTKEAIQMGNKHVKRHFTSYVIREMQMETTTGCHYTPIRVARILRTGSTTCWWGCGAAGALLHCWCACKMVQPLRKTVWKILRKLNILLLYNPAITLPGFYPKELKTLAPKYPCTQMLQKLCS